MGLKESIIQAVDLPLKALEVPEWKCTIYLKVLTGAERNALAIGTENDPGGATLRMLARVICDENGNRVFGDTPSDIAILGGKAAPVLDRITREALDWNKLTSDATKEAEKNY